MHEFELPVTYKGEEQLFPASLQVTGYTHRFVVDVHGQAITFEPDEEGNYRAVITYEELNNSKAIDHALLQVISERIQEILK